MLSLTFGDSAMVSLLRFLSTSRGCEECRAGGTVGSKGRELEGFNDSEVSGSFNGDPRMEPQGFSNGEGRVSEDGLELGVVDQGLIIFVPID